MTIKELIELSKSRINYLNTLRISAVASGDVMQIMSLDAEIAETQNTLNTLLSIEN